MVDSGARHELREWISPRLSVAHLGFVSCRTRRRLQRSIVPHPDQIGIPRSKSAYEPFHSRAVVHSYNGLYDSMAFTFVTTYLATLLAIEVRYLEMVGVFNLSTKFLGPR
jgi:hypothetical protein